MGWGAGYDPGKGLNGHCSFSSFLPPLNGILSSVLVSPSGLEEGMGQRPDGGEPFPTSSDG